MGKYIMVYYYYFNNKQEYDLKIKVDPRDPHMGYIIQCALPSVNEVKLSTEDPLSKEFTGLLLNNSSKLYMKVIFYVDNFIFRFYTSYIGRV